MSRAVVATAFGGPEVLAVIDVEDGTPASGQVAVDVLATGVNPIDVKVYSGTFGRGAPLPMRIGNEAAGVVSAVGVGAVGPRGPVAVGDEVIVYRAPGAYADRLVVDAGAVVPKPTEMSFAAASGLMLTGATAVHALTAAGVAAGTTLLLHGAAGGVGQMAVQIAVSRGARVIATASPSRHDIIRALGGEPVTYGDGLIDRVRALAPDGVDAVIDAVGTDEALDVSLALVDDRSRIATIVATPRSFASGIKVLGGSPGADAGEVIRREARLQLVDLVAAGRLVVAVANSYPLARAADAHREILGGHTAGKIVLVP